ESQGVHVIVSLPQVPLPNWADGVQIGGPITWEAVLTAFAAGLQLATIICCVGAANALASSQRLLRSVPGALYEIGVAAVVAMTFAPQLATDAARVRLASRLRGYDGHGVAAMRRVAMPVFEGALSRSVALAAAMDSRGYGRSFERPTARRLTAALVLGGLLGVCVGVYGLLGAAPRWLGLPVLAAGCLLAAGGLAAGGRRTRRTRYRPDPWALPEWAVSASGIACAAAVFVLGWLEPQAASPPYPLAVPALPVLALVGPLLGLLPAIAAPPPPDRLRRPLPAEASEQGPNGSPGRGSAAPETAR
ncbi:MAG: energy-coupling factor transporter transmembrane component T, partial [Sciscionella sp.]